MFFVLSVSVKTENLNIIFLYYFLSYNAVFVICVPVIGVRLPGRESRMKEPFLTSLSELSKCVAKEIYDNYRDKPFALFGHRYNIEYPMKGWGLEYLYSYYGLMD